MDLQNFNFFYKFGKKIIGFARTYREHALELNNLVPSQPLIFLKPTTSYILEGQAIKLPCHATELHHEVELGVIIGKTGKNIPENLVMDHIAGYVLALDMTDRKSQAEAKKKGLSWCLAKGFDTACPISKFIDKSKIPNPHDVELKLSVNGIEKQNGNTKDMIFDLPFLLSWVSKQFTLEEGDLILTGTPPGVGPVYVGDKIECSLGKDLVNMSFLVEK